MSKKRKNDLRNLCRLITVLSYAWFLFLYNIEHYQRMPFAYIFGVFLACSIPPIICWVSYVIIQFVQKEKIKTQVKKKIDKIDASAEYSQEFNSSIDSLNDLLLVRAITPQEFETKKKLLIRKADALVTQAENLKMNQIQVEKLNDAWKLGVVSEEEYNSKIKNLSEEEIIIKEKIEQLKN
jgi:hypothetical protein